MNSCALFFLCRSFFMFSFQQNSSPLFFISRSSSFSVIHVSVDIKIKSKKRLGLVVVYRLSKNPGGHAIYPQNAQVSEVRNFNPSLHERVDIRSYVRTILIETKFFGCKDNHIFLTMVLLCALPENESSAINFVKLKGTNYGRHSLRKLRYLKLSRCLYPWKNCTNLSPSSCLGVNDYFFERSYYPYKDQVFDFIGYDMTSSARDGTKASVKTYHRIIEAFKFGFAWRSRLGDPAFNNNIDKVSGK